MSRAGRTGVAIAILGLAALSLTPVANWIPSERSALWYPATLLRWTLGTLLVIGLALGLALVSRRRQGLWRDGEGARALAALDPAGTRPLVAVVLAAFLVYLAVAALVFDGRPLHVDEIVQLVQSRMLARGRLWIPVDADPAFRSILHLVERDGRWFGHFPPGWPLLLALGELVRSPWAVGPAVGAVSVLAFGLLLRRVETAPSVRAGALLLFVFAPFTAFMAGSHMNHPAALMWILLGLAGGVGIPERPAVGRATWTGFAFGMAAITRPLDALAFALPTGIWLLARNRTTAVRWLPAMVLGGVVPLAFLAAANGATAGSPFLSGYRLLWGENVGLGFHPVPWGPPHTPLRGLELVNLYLLRLNSVLFETPVPGLLFPLAALWFGPRLKGMDRVFLVSGALLLAGYFAYWHDGVYLGPRFLYPLGPLLALWTARLPRAVLTATGSETAKRTVVYALGLSAAAALGSGIPERAAVYATSQPTLRFDPDRASREAGIGGAVVFVQESWGATLLARLWAAGVPKPAAERVYRNVDSCVLEEALGRIEAAGLSGDSVRARLEPLLADSARLVASPFSPDTSERVLNGARYSRRCVARIAEDRAGFTLFAPLWLARRPELLYVRNLHERNANLLASLPDRPVYLLTQRRDDPVPRFLPLSRDSILGVPPNQRASR